MVEIDFHIVVVLKQENQKDVIEMQKIVIEMQKAVTETEVRNLVAEMVKKIMSEVRWKEAE